MNKISRRTLLKYFGSGLGTMAAMDIMAACKPFINQQSTVTNALSSTNSAPTAPSANQAKATQPSTDTPAPTASNTPSPLPDLVVARGGDPQLMVERALSALGGIERFVPKGGWVIIKPNICNAYHGYEYASTTNPWVVGALVRLCLGAGAKKVQVMDSPFGGTAANAYVTSGIAEQVGLAGGEMVDMPNFKFSPVKIKDAPDHKLLLIYEDIFKADLVINVPIAKTHSLAKLTLGMKNLMGLILNRENIHLSMSKRLTDLNRTIQPGLIVLDAVRILTANGPTGGNLADVKQLDTIIASTDVVAVDSYATRFFDMKPSDIDYIIEASKNGLGVSDLSSVKIEELTVGA
jgi:uncharacterized protein (DUF362 family)